MVPKKRREFSFKQNQEGGTLSLNRHRMELEEGRSPKCTWQILFGFLIEPDGLRERERGIDTIFHHKNVAVLIFYRDVYLAAISSGKAIRWRAAQWRPGATDEYSSCVYTTRLDQSIMAAPRRFRLILNNSTTVCSNSFHRQQSDSS